MRAILRAVLAAGRIPRPTPAAKLSDFLGVFTFSRHGPRFTSSAGETVREG
jgi:hypothetical protein